VSVALTSCVALADVDMEADTSSVGVDVGVSETLTSAVTDAESVEDSVGDEVSVMDGEGEVVGLRLRETLGDCDAVGSSDNVTDTLRSSVAVVVRVRDIVSEFVDDSEAVGLPVNVGDPDILGDSLAVSEAEISLLIEEVMLPLAVIDALLDISSVGLPVCEALDDSDSCGVAVSVPEASSEKLVEGVRLSDNVLEVDSSAVALVVRDALSDTSRVDDSVNEGDKLSVTVGDGVGDRVRDPGLLDTDVVRVGLRLLLGVGVNDFDGDVERDSETLFDGVGDGDCVGVTLRVTVVFLERLLDALTLTIGLTLSVGEKEADRSSVLERETLLDRLTSLVDEADTDVLVVTDELRSAVDVVVRLGLVLRVALVERETETSSDAVTD
jgi:hypothetical protein